MKQKNTRKLFITLMTLSLVFGQFTNMIAQTKGRNLPNIQIGSKTDSNNSAITESKNAEKSKAVVRLAVARSSSVVDAAFYNLNNKKSYFFQGNKYYRLTGTKVDAGYPTSLPGGWKKLPASFRAGIDAAVHLKSNKKIYFFKGNQYVRITGTTVDAGYPKRLPGGWRGMPSEFARGIDAAISHNGYIYMFKGNKQIKFDGNARMVGGVETIPASVKRSGSISAGLHFPANGKNYFFSGSRYTRANGFNTDRGYPQSLPGGWKGIKVQTKQNTTISTNNNTAKETKLIDYGMPPVSQQDEEKIMKWIAIRTAAMRVPYCYRRSQNRGAGKPLTKNCAPGLEKQGLLCYPKCKAGYNGVGPSCIEKCASGFKDIGGFCQKTTSYSRGVGKIKSRCERENKGGCEKSAGAWYPKCKAGFIGRGTRCSQKCPTGQADTGRGCRKRSYTRTAGKSTVCPAGLEKGTKGGKQGLLCYKPCGNSDYTGIGPTCWQKCPVQHPTSCGFGCSLNKKTCAMVVSDQVISPIMATISLATLGSAAAAKKAAEAAKNTTTITKGVKEAQKATLLGKLFDKIKTLTKTGKVAIDIPDKTGKTFATINYVVITAENLKKAKKAVKAIKIGGKVLKASSILGKQVNLFAKEFSKDFAKQTSPEINAEIDRRFGREGADYIKRQWAIRHLSMMLKADGIATAKNVLSLVSVVDPTGLVAVANAYLHPVCKNSAVFPTVRVLNRR